MTTPPRKFSGEKWPRNRAIGDAFEGKVDVGPVTDSSLTMAGDGTLLGRGSSGTGDIEELEITGAAVEIASNQIRFLADAIKANGLGQFADTSSAELRDVIIDPTGSGALVFATDPLVQDIRLAGGPSYVVLAPDHGSTPHRITIPATDDRMVLEEAIQTLLNKTLTSPILVTPALIGALVQQTLNANAATIFDIKNTDTGVSSYSILRLTNGTSNVDMLASHAGTLAQFAGAGSITLFQMVFDTFTWYSLGITQMARMTTAGLRIGPTATPATSMLTCEGSVALGKFVGDFGTTHTIAATTTHLVCGNASGVTITMPSASAFPERVLTIRNLGAGAVVSASSNIIPKAGGAAGTALFTGVPGEAAMLISDGTNWQIQL